MQTAASLSSVSARSLPAGIAGRAGTVCSRPLPRRQVAAASLDIRDVAVAQGEIHVSRSRASTALRLPDARACPGCSGGDDAGPRRAILGRLRWPPRPLAFIDPFVPLGWCVGREASPARRSQRLLGRQVGEPGPGSARPLGP